MLVLGIHRPDGRYVGAPTRDTRVRPGDLLVLCGRAASVQGLDERRSGISGDRGHREAVAEQDDVVRDQEQQERQAEETAG